MERINMKMINLFAGISLCLTLFFPMTMNAQLKQFTLEDLNFGGNNYSNMKPASRSAVWWGNRLVRTEADCCSEINKSSGSEKVLFTKNDLGEDYKDCSLRRAYFPYASQSQVVLLHGSKFSVVDWKKHKTVLEYAIDGVVAQSWSKESKALAYVKDNDLFVATSDGNISRLTNDGSREIVYGQAVHRNEFGINDGLFWSPSGKKMAFYRMDQSMVADYPQVNTFTREATYEPDKYPMAGQTSHKVTVGVYDIQSQKTVYLNTGDPTDRYFTNISWSPESDRIYVFELNRDQNDCRLVAYNSSNGEKIAEIYKETDDKYVEPLHKITFLPWDNTKFLLQSQKDGYNHLYLFGIDGKEVKQLTQGDWVVKDILGFDTKSRSVVIVSNESSPIQQNVYSVNVNTSKRTLADSNGKGWHYASLSEDGLYLWDTYQMPTVPRCCSIVNIEKAKSVKYFEAADPWVGYAVPTYECGTIKAADGTTDLYYRMVKPADFDPHKKYPTVVYVYGGPHAHLVEDSWHYGSRGWETYMAQKGYILFVLDSRGSENRGKDFEQVTFRHLGVEEMKDQMKGVDFLKSLPYVDADRLGVHGWSFGGFMTTSLMTTYPDVFKVGVAGGPVIDWKWYEVMYGERYMDTPQSNPEGYAETSLIEKAKNLKGKLQIIIGMNDPTVVPQHALQFLNACEEAGTQPDFFVYPGQGHNMMGHKSVHLHERITQYFEDYLK